jgi:hypothetical protein
MTLTDLKNEFTQWRSSRNSRAEPIPEALWKKAIALSDTHGSGQICTELSLSGGQFKIYKDKFSASNEFIEIEPIAPEAPKSQNCSITLRANNKELILDMPITEVISVLPAFEKLLQ